MRRRRQWPDRPEQPVIIIWKEKNVLHFVEIHFDCSTFFNGNPRKVIVLC